MKKLDLIIHGISWKLRIKKNRNDAGTLTLGVTLRPKYKGGTSKRMSFHYFSNGKISKLQWTDQKGNTNPPKTMTLQEAKVFIVKYLLNDYKPFLIDVINNRTK